jgi:pimeloyl-ACP methyl ester carboxylesterase
MKHSAPIVLGALPLPLVLLVLAASSAGLVSACSEETPAPLTAPDGGGGDGGSALSTPSNACTDAVDSIYGDPGALSADPAARGNIVKCAKDAPITKDALQAKVNELGYAGKPLTSGAQVYRVSYRTERGDAASTPSVSSAIVYIPDVPRAAKLPVVVAGRGSRGQAAACAVSKFDASQSGINGDAYRMVYPLVGAGYAVILSDLAGYANFGAAKNPPSAYAQATDVGRSTLDSGRALKKLFPSLDDKVVLVGHSQGGHSALASLALVDTYGTAAPIVGVAVYAPLWLSQRSWGAVLSSIGRDFPVEASAAPAVSVWYHYTQAELLDGPGEGKKLFAASKADAIESFVKNTCWDQKAAVLKPLGTYAEEYFDPAFVAAVAKPSLGIVGDCPATDAVCLKWKARYSSDRPHLTGKAASTPILLAYGGKDTTIPPGRMKCALDRLREDNAQLSVCVDPDTDHGGVVSSKADYVSDWIARVALGAPAPAACASGEAAVSVPCETPPPND